jgi:D-alanyl-D-alanine carboxypeptidase/D-alanyl-D-alanine-endopeptidase (penicillin-binding protein 4)
VLRVTLDRLGLDLSSAVLRDGSGLSHQNRVSARQVCELLVIMRRHPHAGVFRESLAVAGEEGSMKRRLSGSRRGRLVGKTGTLRQVSTLAGYLTRDGGGELAFALLINGNKAGDLLQRICGVLADPRP